MRPTPVPGSGVPLFQAATANINPFTEIKVDTRNATALPTQIQEIPDRGHSLVFDSSWQDVAETALAFIKTRR
jgi:non-heme chloroperoxidase